MVAWHMNGYSNILGALKKVGIKNGDAIFVHSSMSKFGTLPKAKNQDGFLSPMLRALKEAVGKNGTILMPTFTYSFAKNEIYDPARTPSTVGILTEYFRQQKGAIRTIHPLFSVAAWGKKKKYYTSNLGKDCFGKNSVFGKMHKKNVKIIFLGAPFQSCTFVHYIEQLFNVPYRFYKSFRGKIVIGKKLFVDTYEYFVRPLNGTAELDLSRFGNYLLKNKYMKKATLGKGEILAVAAKTLVSEGMKMLKKNNRYFLKI